MRRFRICEERGSGIDKVVFEVELYQLPDRVRACYLHACLRCVTRQPMTNSSLREPFGITEKNASAASRLLNEAVAAGLIAVEDTTVGTRARTYLPYWATPRARPREIA